MGLKLFLLLHLFLLTPGIPGQSIMDAQSKESSGDWAGAAQIWQALAQSAPRDYRLWTSLGITLAHQERFPDAIAAYQKAIAIAPRDPQTNFNLGLAYFKTNRLNDAIAPLRTAAEVMPDYPQIDLILGMSLYGAGHFRAAGAALERSRAEGQAQTAEFQQVLAQCYLRTKEYEKATTELTGLLRLNPDSASTHMFLGEAEDANGRSDKAIEQFRLAIAADDRLPDLHFGLGYLLWKDRFYEEAEAQFRKEIALDPKHTQALSYLGDVLLKRSAKAEAEATLRKAAAGSRLWLTYLDLGIIAAAKQDWASAVRQFSKAAKLSPERPEPHYRLAQVYKKTGESSKAALELRKVANMHRQKEEDLVQKISGPAIR